MTEIIIAVIAFTAIVLVLSLLVLAARRALVPSGTCEVLVNDTRTIPVAAGQRLLHALNSSGINLPSACGGAGTCGLCKVKVVSGESEPAPQDQVTATESSVGESSVAESWATETLAAESSAIGHTSPAQPAVKISRFPSSVNALVNRVEPTLSVTLTDADWAEEAPIPRVCTSEGAEGFANLLMECVADSQKSLPLSGQTQLRMAVGHSIF